jgi:hypothetical protein
MNYPKQMDFKPPHHISREPKIPSLVVIDDLSTDKKLTFR